MIKRIKLVIFFLASFLFFSATVLASGSATTAFSGKSSVYVGDKIEVILYVKSVSGTNGGLAAFGGTISYPTDLLTLEKSTSLAPFAVELNGNKLGGFGQSYIKGKTNIIKLTFKAKATGSATISYSGSSQPDATADSVAISGCSKTIKIKNAPSSNNYLSSLTVSEGAIDFSKTKTSYTVNVGSDITSIKIAATAEDSGAKVSGTGTKTLDYGNNNFDIVVTAASGAKKTYTLTINRKDNRSSNNNLSSLSVSSGDLNPKFSKNTTTYSLEVPYSVSDLTVTAKPEDSKAKVSVSGNKNLVAEQTNKVTVNVTAENGSTKTYTINVKRGKDPNKALSDNNYLAKLNASIGILSPEFDKEKTTYEIWLPYEVEEITFDYEVEDTVYAQVTFDGPEKLQAGISNVYEIKVTAENNEERIYTINVKRASNPSDNSSNIYLSNIILKNGNLTTEFDKEIFEYYYTKKDGFEIEAIPEDSGSAVTVIEHEDTTYLIVTSSSGEYGVYSLQLKETNIMLYIIAGCSIIGGFVLGFITKTIMQKKKNKKIKLNDKEQA